MRTLLYRTLLSADDVQFWASVIDSDDGRFLVTTAPVQPGEEGRRQLHEIPEQAFDEVSRVVEGVIARGDTIYLEQIDENSFERRHLEGRTTGPGPGADPAETVVSRAWADQLLDSWVPQPEPGSADGPARSAAPTKAPSLRLDVEYDGSLHAMRRVPGTGRMEPHEVHYHVRSFVPEGSGHPERPAVIIISDLAANGPADFDMARARVAHAVQQEFGLRGFPRSDQTVFIIHYPRDVHGDGSPERFVRAEFGYDPSDEDEHACPRTNRLAEMPHRDVLDLLGPEAYSELCMSAHGHSLARRAFEHGLGASRELGNDPDLDP